MRKQKLSGQPDADSFGAETLVFALGPLETWDWWILFRLCSRDSLLANWRWELV